MNIRLKKWKVGLWVSVLSGISISVVSLILGLRYSSNEVIKANNLSNKHLELFKLAVKWIRNPEKLEKFINDNRNSVIGIYGMSYLGDCLQEVFKKKGIVKIYGIDKNACKLYNPDILIYNMENELPDMDIIIVTAFTCFEQIKQELEMKIGEHTNIISLEDIFYL